jgi:hypothetical protein
MRTPIAAIPSLCACVLVACGAWMLLNSAANLLVFHTTMYAPDAVLLAVAVVGFAAWAGASVWEGTVPHTRRDGAAGRHGMLLAFSALVTGVLLGAPFGIAVSRRADQSISIALLVLAAAAVALICGLATRLQPRSVLLLGVIIAAYCVVGGIGFGLGFGLQFAITYTDPCLHHHSCLEGSPWLGLQGGLPTGVISGFVLGVVIWVALALDLTVSSRLQYPLTNAEA